METLPIVRPNTDEDWQPHYQDIRRLWWDEERTLAELVIIMKDVYGFSATDKQYKRMLDKWNLGKNVKTKEMRAIVKILLARQPKKTEFRLRDRSVPQEKINRFLLRTVGTLAPSLSTFSPLGFTPCHLQYYTPKATFQQSRCTTPGDSAPGTPVSDGWMNEFIHMSSPPSSTQPLKSDSRIRNGHTTPAIAPTLISSSLTLPPEEIVTILTEHHSGIRNCPIDLFRVFCWAVAEGNEELKSQVLKQELPLSLDYNDPDTGTLTHYMAKRGDSGFLSLLLGQDIDINLQTAQGRTALHLAVVAGHESVVQILLVKKADPNIHKDSRTMPPLHQAIIAGNIAIVKRLLSGRASTSLRAASGDRPLHLAVEKDEVFVRTLLEAGAVVTYTGSNGDTALHRAVRLKRIDVVKLLCAYAPPHWIVDRMGYAPLHCAIAQNDYSMAELLIDNRASPTYATSFGSSPLHLAVTATSPNAALVRLLLDNGATVLALDTKGSTSADLVRRVLTQAPQDLTNILFEILCILEAATNGHCYCESCTTNSGDICRKSEAAQGAKTQGIESNDWFSDEQSAISWSSSVDCTF